MSEGIENFIDEPLWLRASFGLMSYLMTPPFASGLGVNHNMLGGEENPTSSRASYIALQKGAD